MPAAKCLSMACYVRLVEPSQLCSHTSITPRFLMQLACFIPHTLDVRFDILEVLLTIGPLTTFGQRIRTKHAGIA